MTNDKYLAYAAYYALYLRQLGYAPDEVAVLVMKRYPRSRPHLERFLRPRLVESLAGTRPEAKEETERQPIYG